jgi:hypothetical protein
METTNVKMKNLIALLISGALVVSGYSQTRNVLVGTNNAVVQPTNFWSADASNARSGLGLGSAATNPASAFQPSSTSLSNLAAGNGSSLTNITATIVGTNIAISNVTGLQSALDGKLATNGNTTGTASNVTGVVTLVNGGTGATNAASARTSLGATTVGGNIFTLANPDEIRFLRLNANSSVSALTAADFRTAIGVSTGLGTVTSVGMTVPSILSLSTPTITSSGTFALTLANQTSRHAFLAPNGGGVPAFRALDSDDLPALAIAKITGLQTALDGKLATSGTATLATNVTGIVALANGGTGANSAATARTGLGATTVGGNIFTLANPSAIRFLRLNNDNTATALSDSDFRTAIGLGTAATNPATAFQPSSTVLSNLASSNGGSLTNIAASNVTGTIAISNGGSGATTAGGARTNLELGITNIPSFRRLVVDPNASGALGVQYGTNDSGIYNGGTYNQLSLRVGGVNALTADTNGVTFASPATTRTNLGLGWSALTDSNAATSLLGVATNGNVVYTNTNPLTFTNNVGFSSGRIEIGGGLGFWDATDGTYALFFQQDDPVLLNNRWNDDTVRASLGLPLAALTNTNVTNFRSAIGLGWPALTNSNAGTGLVSVNTNGEVVSPTNFWQVAPITTTFIDSQPTTNQTTNIAAGRNLHIHSVAFSTVGITNTIALPTTNSFNGDIALVVHQGPTSSVTAVRTAGAGTNLITLNQFEEAVEFVYYNNVWQFNHNRSFIEPIFFSGTNAAANRAASRTNLGLGITNDVQFKDIIAQSLREVSDQSYITFDGDLLRLYADADVMLDATLQFGSTNIASATRTNLGLPLAALTNTNNANFQAAIFNTNSVPTNSANVNAINFNTAVHWMEVTVKTNGTNATFRIPLFQ